MSKQVSTKTKAIVEADKKSGEKYVLQLFITGILPNSVRAVKNVNAICEKHLPGRYELEIIDIYQQPSLALQQEIIAVPVLIKKSPLPEERMIGDFSNVDTVLMVLNIS